MLNLSQRLGAAPPDPRIWDHLPPQFRTPLLNFLRTGLDVEHEALLIYPIF